MYAKQSTAKTFLLGPILDEDGAAKTDEVVGSIKVTKNGSVAGADASSTLTHNHTGHYVYAADADDFDTLGEVQFSLNSGTNAMAPVAFQVVPANVYDSLVSGSDYIKADAVQIEGADATDTIRDAVVDDATRIDASALNTLSGHDPGATIASQSDVTSLNDLSAADVNAEVDTALSDYDPPTKTEMDNKIDALNNLSAADVNAEVDTALSDYGANTVVPDAAGTAPTAAEIKTALEADGSKLDHLWETTEDDGGVRRFTANALEEAPAGGAGGGDATEANQTTILGHLTDIKGGGFDAGTDTLEDIRDVADTLVPGASINLVIYDTGTP